MKIIGVLGGVGPQATMDFERRVHDVSRRLIPPDGNRGYPPMIVHYHRRPPVRMQDDGTPAVPFEPDPEFLEAARWLGSRADFVVITSNAPHMFRAQIERAAGREVLSMIDLAVDEVRRRRWRRIGVLGAFAPGVPVYTEPLRGLNLACELIDAALQSRLDQSILRLAEGRETGESRAAAREAVAVLRARGVEGIILGCTEIPLLLGPESDGADLVSPLALLAEAAVRLAVG